MTAVASVAFEKPDEALTEEEIEERKAILQDYYAEEETQRTEQSISLGFEWLWWYL